LLLLLLLLLLGEEQLVFLTNSGQSRVQQQQDINERGETLGGPMVKTNA
jgi:hypothetical protein